MYLPVNDNKVHKSILPNTTSDTSPIIAIVHDRGWWVQNYNQTIHIKNKEKNNNFKIWKENNIE